MTIRLLLVEDDDSDAELVRHYLSKSHPSCSIYRVQTEGHFLSALTELRPDLILSDCYLPQFDGLRALELASTRAARTPFILMSGSLSAEGVADARRRGAVDYVPKHDMSKLPLAIDLALQRAERRPIAI